MEPLVLIAVAVIAAIGGAVVGMLARGYWASQSMKAAQSEAAGSRPRHEPARRS